MMAPDHQREREFQMFYRVITVSAVLVLAMAGCRSTTTSTSVLQERADHAFWQTRFADASVDYRELVHRYPGNWKAQARLGECLLDLQDYPAAREALQVAQTLHPSDAALTDLMAEAIFMDNDRAALFVYLVQDADAQQTPYAYLRLAKYAGACDDPDTARDANETAIRLDNDQTVEPYLSAAALETRLGNETDAIVYLRRGYAVDPLDKRVQQRLRELGEIPGPTLAMPPDEPQS